MGLSDNSTSFEIAKYAWYHLLRPISSAAAERIFSYLTHMDTSRRRRMKKTLLALNLYVRGNWRIKNMLVAEAAQRLRAASALAAETGISRRVDEQLARVQLRLLPV